MTHRILPTTRATALILGGLLLLPACGDDGDGDDAGNNAVNNDANNDANNDVNNDTNNDTPNNDDPNNEVDPTLSVCGGFEPQPFGEVNSLEACAQCIDQECCDEAAACGDDPGCLALRQCFMACELGDGDCIQACEDAASEEVLDLNLPMITCRNQECAAPCVAQVDLTCVGTPEPTPATTPGTATMAVVLGDFQTRGPLPGVTVKLCAAQDAECAEPLDEAVSDGEGNLTLELELTDTPFEGYLEMTGGGVAPSLSYFSRPVTEGDVFDFSVISQNSFNAFAGLLGLTLDAQRGHIAVVSQDCSRRRARNVVLSASTADDQTTIGYVVGSLPSPAATATDASGVGGIFNLPPGTATVQSTNTDGDRLMNERTVVVRAGFLSTYTGIPNR